MPRNTEPLELSGERWDRVRELAARQSVVLSRRQLLAVGIRRWEITGHLRARRWQKLGDQALALHNGLVSETGHRWAAVFQGGPRACLDGASALLASGLERYDVERVRVSVPRGARIRRSKVYDIRQTRRWSADDLAPNGIPRTQPAVAAIRAALWAKTDKQAAYLLSLTVQQGLARPADLGEQLLRVRRDKRRLFLHAVVNDLIDGARALGELDVVRELRRRGLPTPKRQVLRRDKRGRYYLDLYWPELGVVVEIDGIHHTWAQNVIGDALRQNSLTLSRDVVLRLPLLGLRLQPEEFFDQIAQALEHPGNVIRLAPPGVRAV